MDEREEIDEIRERATRGNVYDTLWYRHDTAYLLKALDAAEQRVKELDLANYDVTQNNRGLWDELTAAEQRAALGEGLLRIIASYDYSLDCPYCTIRNDAIHEPGCEYQAIVKYLEGVEVDRGTRRK